MWHLRARQNGIKVVGKIYTWKPTKSIECGRFDERKFTGCMLALICANVMFVVFLFWFVGQIR